MHLYNQPKVIQVTYSQKMCSANNSTYSSEITFFSHLELMLYQVRIKIGTNSLVIKSFE